MKPTVEGGIKWLTKRFPTMGLNYGEENFSLRQKRFHLPDGMHNLISLTSQGSFAHFKMGSSTDLFTCGAKTVSAECRGEYHQNNRHGEFLEWNQYGILTSSRQYRFNKLHGDSTLWYDSGKVRLESYFLYGHIIDAQGWFPDGNPCPFSRVTNGKGLVLRYDENFSSEGKPAGALRSSFRKVDDWELETKFNPLVVDDQ